jgi:hypothetical protein
MSHTPEADKNKKLSTAELELARKIKLAVEKASRESVQNILASVLPPGAADFWLNPIEDLRELEKKWERKALEAAESGNGPQPFDRDWYKNGYDFHEMLEEWEFDWHLTNDFLEVMNWALSSGEGQRALALGDSPDSIP